jgi:hypothetical protein
MTTQNKPQTNEPAVKPIIHCEKCGNVIDAQWWDAQHPKITPKWFFQCHVCPDASSFALSHEAAMKLTAREHTARHRSEL